MESICVRYCHPIFKLQTSKHEKSFCHRPKWVQAQTAPWMAGPNELNGFQTKAVQMGLGTKCSQWSLDSNVPKGSHAEIGLMGSRRSPVLSHLFTQEQHILSKHFEKYSLLWRRRRPEGTAGGGTWGTLSEYKIC